MAYVSSLGEEVPWGFQRAYFSMSRSVLCMAFAQLTYRESLRDIEACLGAQPGKTLLG